MHKIPIFTNLNGKTYDSTIIIIYQLTKMIYYKPIKLSIYNAALAKVIMKIVIHYYDLFNSIISN